MEFKVASASQDIDNMRRRIEVQKEQLKTSQKFVEKLEKERREVESMYEKLRQVSLNDFKESRRW